MGSADILKKNISEFLNEAKQAELNKSYNSAATLYFKALAVLADYYILKKEGIIPKNHTERFNLLKGKYDFLYDILDKDFPLYQKTYSLEVKKDTVEVLRNDTKKVIEFIQFKKD